MSEETLAATIKHGPIRFIYGLVGAKTEGEDESFDGLRTWV